MSYSKKLPRKKKIELLIITGIIFAITAAFIIFSEEIGDIFQAIVQQFGLVGLFAITIIMDTVIQPISPDVLTMGYSMSNTNTLIVALVGGTASIIAGIIGYGIGHFLEEEGIDKFIGQKKYKKAHNLFVKYGFWAILIGALSPVPFSAICWSAGVFRMPWKFFCISITVTRLPRFLIAGYLGVLLS